MLYLNKIKNYYSSHREPCITIIILAAAYLFRILIILNFSRLGIGYSYDLQDFYELARTSLSGENPYKIYDSYGKVWVADILPLEILFFSVLLFFSQNYLEVSHPILVAPQNVPLQFILQIYLIYAFVDIMNIYLLGLIFQNSKFKRHFQIFYAFNPLFIFNFLIVGQDKSIIFLLLLIVIYLIKQTSKNSIFNKRVLVVTSAAFLASFKWIGFSLLVPLVLHFSNSIKERITLIISFIGLFSLTHLLWYPYSLNVYQLRALRTLNPGHQSLLSLIPNSNLISTRYIYITLLIFSLLTVYVLFIVNRINLEETAVFSVFAFMIWMPDLSLDHIALISVSLMLIADWAKTISRIIVTWILGIFVGTGMIAYNAVFAFNNPKITSVLLSIYGTTPGTKLTIISQLLIIYLLSVYIYMIEYI